MNQHDVFVNCPFTPDYRDFFVAILYSIQRSGFRPRCALESVDGGEVRMDKICRIIADSRYGIHDISRTELDADTGLPRFNMPLELGLYLGARTFGGRRHSNKKVLILDRARYRYQQFISDIAGQDIESHDADVGKLIERVAAWLRSESRDPRVPGGRAIWREYERFRQGLPTLASSRQLEVSELTFHDLTAMIAGWILADNATG